jgi:hypothetical protein
MHMTEEKKHASGFRVKWADREIEYYGDSVQEVFESVFSHVKSVPINYVQQSQPTVQISTEPSAMQPLRTPTPTGAEGVEYGRLVIDSKATKEQVSAVIKFEKRSGFSEFVPYLPGHPEARDAVVLVSYAVQVGLQKTPIEVTYLKKLLKGPNGYPLPGNMLGMILKDFRNADVTIASQVKGRYKPFTLGKKGLERARKLLNAGTK